MGESEEGEDGDGDGRRTMDVDGVLLELFGSVKRVRREQGERAGGSAVGGLRLRLLVWIN